MCSSIQWAKKRNAARWRVSSDTNDAGHHAISRITHAKIPTPKAGVKPWMEK
jgi:hypothetical protein